MDQKIIQLENGQYLLNDYGKYCPNLTYVFNKENVKWDDGRVYFNWENINPVEMFNLECRTLSALRGDYWKSKKGTDCFRPHANGKHWLVSERWHGRGSRELFNHQDFRYFRCASSNGGGTGHTYAVIPVGWQRRVSIDDI